MRTRAVLCTLVFLVAAGLLALPAATAGEGTDVWVPAGTRVALAFVTPVDSGVITTGAKVRLKVSADVVGGRYVIVRAGTPVVGTVTKVTQPGIFGASSEVVIGFIAVTAVDGRPISLQDVTISKETITSARGSGGGERRRRHHPWPRGSACRRPGQGELRQRPCRHDRRRYDDRERQRSRAVAVCGSGPTGRGPRCRRRSRGRVARTRRGAPDRRGRPCLAGCRSPGRPAGTGTPPGRQSARS